MRIPAPIFAALASLCLLAAGCGDAGDAPAFKRPRLSGRTYLSARADPAGRIEVELTNVGDRPLSGLFVGVVSASQSLPGHDRVALAPSQTLRVGGIEVPREGEAVQVMILSDTYFPQFYFISRGPGGALEVSEDGYGGRTGYAEYFVRHSLEESASDRRWATIGSAAKVAAACAGLLAAGVVLGVVAAGRRRSVGAPRSAPPPAAPPPPGPRTPPSPTQ